jgi:hypothetical protein
MGDAAPALEKVNAANNRQIGSFCGLFDLITKFCRRPVG